MLKVLQLNLTKVKARELTINVAHHLEVTSLAKQVAACLLSRRCRAEAHKEPRVDVQCSLGGTQKRYHRALCLTYQEIRDILADQCRLRCQLSFEAADIKLTMQESLKDIIVLDLVNEDMEVG